MWTIFHGHRFAPKLLAALHWVQGDVGQETEELVGSLY